MAGETAQVFLFVWAALPEDSVSLVFMTGQADKRSLLNLGLAEGMHHIGRISCLSVFFSVGMTGEASTRIWLALPFGRNALSMTRKVCLLEDRLVTRAAIGSRGGTGGLLLARQLW